MALSPEEQDHFRGFEFVSPRAIEEEIEHWSTPSYTVANTSLVPLLARREVLVRFPFNTDYLDRKGRPQSVDWVAVDLDLLQRYGRAFAGDWRQLRNSKRWIEQHRQAYRVQSLEDGVVVLQKDGPINAPLELALDQTLQQPLPANPRRRRS